MSFIQVANATPLPAGPSRANSVSCNAEAAKNRPINYHIQISLYQDIVGVALMKIEDILTEAEGGIFSRILGIYSKLSWSLTSFGTVA